MFPESATAEMPPEVHLGPFTPMQRRIFAYEVNGQRLFADPLSVRRRLDFYLGAPLNEVLAVVHGNDPSAAFEAEESLLKAARLAFDEPFDKTTGKGATEEELRLAVGGLTDFLSGAASAGVIPPPCYPSLDPMTGLPVATMPTSDSFST